MSREADAAAAGYPEAIVAQLLEFERAVRDSDLTGAVLKSLYERGAPIYSVGFPLPPEFRFSEFLQCVVSGPLAASWELWEATVEIDGGSVPLQGRSTEIWRQQDDGVWKMAYDHASIAVNVELAVRSTADIRGLGGTRGELQDAR